MPNLFSRHFLPQPGGTHWLLLVGSSTSLTAEFIMRGPLPVNIVFMTTAGVDLKAVSDELQAGLFKCDGLASLSYASDLREKLYCLESNHPLRTSAFVCCSSICMHLFL